MQSHRNDIYVRGQHAAARVIMAFAGFIGSCAGMGLTPWAPPSLGCGGGFLAAALVPVLDTILVGLAWYRHRLLLGRCLLVAIFAFGGVAAGLALGISAPEAAFREVFGMHSPSEVKSISGQREYAGIFDRDDILLRFEVDEAGLLSILSGQGFERDEASVRAYASGKMTWAQFVDDALIRLRGKYGNWGPGRPMQAPALYRRFDVERSGTTRPFFADVAVLWDAATGQTYVHRPGG